MNVNFLKLHSVIPFVMTFAICLGSFVMGYSLVVIPLLQNQISRYNLVTGADSDYYISLATTALPLGAIIGCLVMKDMCDRFGQNLTLCVIDMMAVFASLLQMSSLKIYPLLFSRLLMGIYCGINSGVVPTYITSLAPPHMVGALGTLNQLLITIGISMAYYFDSISEMLALPQLDLEAWQIIIGLPAVYALVRMKLLLEIKIDTLERHYHKADYAIMKKYIEFVYRVKGQDYLPTLILRKNLNQNRITSNNKKSNSKSISGSNAVFQLAVVVAIANQMSGINAILFYANQLFTSIKPATYTVKDCVLYLGAFQVFVTVIGSLLIDRIGRRTLMLIGQGITTGSLLMGWFFMGFVPDSQSTVVFFIFMHILGFNLSIGPVTMVYISEIMTNLSTIVLLIWSLTFFVSLISQVMITTYGIGKVLLFYGVLSTVCLIYLNQNMVESKNKNRVDLISEIEGKLASYNQQRRSGQAQGKGLLQSEDSH